MASSLTASATWPACVVTVFDLIGIRALAAEGKASFEMIRMREFATAKINAGMGLHSYAYVWNDSVQLLSYYTTPASARRRVLAELDSFKTALEKHCSRPTYAVSVKGLAFPDHVEQAAVFDGQIAHQPRVTCLKTSSWAMTNCFVIEEKLKHHRADWYIDGRIVKDCGLAEPFARESLMLWPKKVAREIQMFRGSLNITV